MKNLCFLRSFAFAQDDKVIDKLGFGGMITIVCQRRPCKEIPLLGEMSAEQTKGCPFSEKKLASVSETEGFVTKQQKRKSHIFQATPLSLRDISPYRGDSSILVTAENKSPRQIKIYGCHPEHREGSYLRQ